MPTSDDLPGLRPDARRRSTANRAADPPPPPGRMDSDSRLLDSTIRLQLGRGRILTTPSPISKTGDIAVIAVGDPSVADFEVLPNPRMLRLIGKRPGITDSDTGYFRRRDAGLSTPGGVRPRHP